MKKLMKLISSLLILMLVLYMGDTNLKKLSHDVELQTPEYVERNLSKVNPPKIDTPEIKKPNIKTPDITKPEKDKPETPKKELSAYEKYEIDNLFAKIRVSKEVGSDYSREDYERPRKSYKMNGKRYSRNKFSVFNSEYLVKDDFLYKCPFTGQDITDASKIDYDHIIPLNYVEQFGDTGWTKERKNEYSYNQTVGVGVLNSANRSKADKGPADWLPDINKGDYCYTWLLIAAENDIALREKDISVMKLEIMNTLSTKGELKRLDSEKIEKLKTLDFAMEVRQNAYI